MKKLIFTLGVLVPLGLYAQAPLDKMATAKAIAKAVAENDAPPAVKEAFKKANPKAKSVKWETEEDGFEVEYRLNGKKKEAVYDGAGQLLYEEVDIKRKDLPAAAQTYLKQYYGSWKIDEIEKHIAADGVVSYHIEAKGKTKEFVHSFDAEGKYLKSVEVLEKQPAPKKPNN